MEKKETTDIRIVMIVLLVHCMQTVYLAFWFFFFLVQQNKSSHVFIGGLISPQFNILFYYAGKLNCPCYHD